MSSLAQRIALQGRTLREHTARGTIINGAYLAGFYTLSLLRGFVAAAFLSASEYGVWGIALIALYVLVQLKQAGIVDRYVQQDEPDDEAAFQRALTLEVLLTVALVAVAAISAPLVALAYGRSDVVLPLLVLALAPLAAAFQTPVWIFYRRMEFARQRRLQAVDPIVAFAVTVGLAVAGAGYWCLVVGTVAGALAGAAVAVRASPYRLRWAFDARALREYGHFSWPLMVATLTPVVMAQGSVVVGERELGLAGAGYIVLASSIADYTNRIDSVLTQTLYPAICAVRERTDLLVESFVKSNRLALMWGIPFGVAVALFASDLVEFGLGERWRPAVGLIATFGGIAAANHIAFNWDAYFRARGRTRPIAWWSLATLAAFLAVGMPLLASHGLGGLALGMGVTTAVSLAVRAAYLKRMFPSLRLAPHALRSVAPTIPAVAGVLLVRWAMDFERTLPVALGELALYAAVTVLATVTLERALLGEVSGYLRRAGGGRVATA